MKKIIVCAFLPASAMLLFTNCSKSDSSTAGSSANFTPLTVATNWTYKYSENGGPSNTFKLTVTNRDTVANGKTYKVISNSDGTTTYMAKVGSEYYRFASFPSIGINNFEELYLKDDKAVNDNWLATTSIVLNGTTIPVSVTHTIKGKGESRTVNGVAFNNVTHVRLDITAAGFGIGGGDFYYQDGVGLIEDVISVNAGPGSSYASNETLVSYQIK